MKQGLPKLIYGGARLKAIDRLIQNPRTTPEQGKNSGNGATSCSNHQRPSQHQPDDGG